VALSELHYFSAALDKMTAATVILPEGEGVPPGPYPVFYLLHGLSDDYTAWRRRTSVERYAEGMPLIIVMPDGGRGWYTDAREGYAYETAIARDLVGLVDRVYHTGARRAARVVGGLSMGGYGAVKLALTYPDLFCGAVSHSGALVMARWSSGEGGPADDRARVHARLRTRSARWPGRSLRPGRADRPPVTPRLAHRLRRGGLPARPHPRLPRPPRRVGYSP